MSGTLALVSLTTNVHKKWEFGSVIIWQAQGRAISPKDYLSPTCSVGRRAVLTSPSEVS